MAKHNTTDRSNKLKQDESIPTIGRKQIIHRDSKRSFNNIEYKPTGCMEFDMLVCCVMDFRARQVPLKRILVKPSVYDRMDEFCRKNKDFPMPDELRDEYCEERRYVIDGVNIDRSESMFQSKTLEFEYHPMVRPEEALFENRPMVDFSSLDKKYPEFPERGVLKHTITKID